MKKYLAAAAIAAAGTATLATPAQASPPREPANANAPAAAPLDIVGDDIDYDAAARAEGMTVPAHNYRISARHGQAGTMWSSGHHTGLDFAAPVGTGVDAADSGRVVHAQGSGAYGNMIEIVHGTRTRTRYAHLSNIDVRKGERVVRGEHIGDLGTTGNSSGPHLHFEVLVHGKDADPERFLNL